MKLKTHSKMEKIKLVVINENAFGYIQPENPTAEQVIRYYLEQRVMSRKERNEAQLAKGRALINKTKELLKATECLAK